jgi:uncharacterized damage-inducible protein DinB
VNAAQLFDHWNVVWKDLLRAVSVLSDRHLEARPTKKMSRTVGGLLRHIINLEQGWIHFVIRRAIPAWPDEGAERLTSVDLIRKEMDRVHKQTMDYLATVPVEDLNRIVQVPEDGTPKLGWILWHVLEQEIHHRGELFLCLDLLGLERPDIDRPS